MAKRGEYWKGKKLSETHRKKLSEAAKNWVGYWNRKKFSKYHRENLSKAKTGSHYIGRRMLERSLIHRKHLSIALKRCWSVQENKERIRLIHIGIRRRHKKKESNGNNEPITDS